MIFSTDFAPRRDSGLFIGLWRSITDAGMMAGPLAVGFIAQYTSLGYSPLILGMIGLFSVFPVITHYKQGDLYEKGTGRN